MEENLDGYPFFEDWLRRQAEPLPEMTKPKEKSNIGINDIPTLLTGKENESND